MRKKIMISKDYMRIARNVCGVGVDIEDIAPFKKVLSNKNFITKTFTSKEVDYCMGFSSPENHLAVRFAGKEAILKAIAGSGVSDIKIPLNKIEILNRKDGSPFVEVKEKFLKDRFVYLISLSHSSTRAMAFSVIGEKR